MPVITRSALVSHPASDMYLLVQDIESYPEFLPWCDSASVQEQSDSHQVARVALTKKLRQAAFTTRNRLTPGQSIHMSLVDGPFRYLEGQWTFTPIGDAACRAELEVNFEFGSRVFATLVGPAFKRICDSLVNSFIARADQVIDSAGYVTLRE